MPESSKRQQFIEALKSRLDELNEDMERLEKRAQEARGEFEEKYAEQLVEMREKRDQMKEKLIELRASSEAHFERIKGEAEYTWKAFQNSVNYFKSHFK
ncbi:MAG: sll1863 family stress response protein [Wenzhouxiangella sp.]